MRKKIFIALIVAAVLLAGVFFFDRTNIEPKIKEKIEKEGSSSTQTPVRLISLKLDLKQGDASFGGLTVGNPKGFFSLEAMTLGAIESRLDPSTVSGDAPLVIHQLVIDKPEVTYEVTTTGDVNLQTIERNLLVYSGGLNAAPSGPGKRLIVDDLYIRDGKLTVSDAMLNRKDYQLPLPAIHLTGIGRRTNGASQAQIAEAIIGKLAADASRIAAADIARQIGPANPDVPARPGIPDNLKEILGR